MTHNRLSDLASRFVYLTETLITNDKPEEKLSTIRQKTLSPIQPLSHVNLDLTLVSEVVYNFCCVETSSTAGVDKIREKELNKVVWNGRHLNVLDPTKYGYGLRIENYAKICVRN
ncbi:hypothetical protein CEXT_663011 [Caerostris extrusa]|uniref:Uncharacterized protein n=1 Tax=Caerostris extrusa TaxID=172846 RepID=A0AAV4MB07_CAEEX|nr:hypothetical protein CEXT_663011 [Caerostris extrusa]